MAECSIPLKYGESAPSDEIIAKQEAMIEALMKHLPIELVNRTAHVSVIDGESFYVIRYDLRPCAKPMRAA